jgi:hypothetical protein
MTLLNLSKPLRHKMAFAAASVFAPKLGADLKTMYNKTTTDLPRPFTVFLKETFGDRPLKICEIGYGRGANAENLLEQLNISELYCVDPFFGETYTATGKVIANWGRDFETKNRMNRLIRGGKVWFVKKPSDRAFAYLPTDLDAVYIDGNHSYNYAYRDIVNGLAHVKPGGFVGGHDACNNEFPDVSRAVVDYAVKSGLRPVICNPDFWFEKPKERH